MWINKRQELKRSYYRSFAFLIVIPILIIILISIAIIRTMIQDSGIQNIRRAQDNIVSTLNSEVKDVSLRLSHFVYVNDNEIMKMASKTDTSNLAERHHYAGTLTESFNYAMVPVQDILSTIFFMKSSRTTYMKDNIVLSDTEVKSAQWYQDALADPNMVKIGFYNKKVTSSSSPSHAFTIVAGLAPDIDLDRDGCVEMAALFVYSSVGNLIRDYDKEGTLGNTMLLDQDGNVLFDRHGSEDILPKKETLQGENLIHYKINGKKYVCVISEEPMTNCKIVTVIALGILTRTFNQVALIIVGVMLVLFMLFYFFSSYFLRNIVTPIHNTVEGMKAVESGDLEAHVEPEGQSELRTMIHSFNRMTRHLKQLIQENQENEQKKHEAEIRALQSQINPHFLVNSLNSIRFIAQVSKFDSIAKMAEALIKILSCSFRSNVGFYKLKEELEVVDSFIYLMKIRYSDGFEIHYDVELECMDCLVPRLILQPIIENSIVHGFDEMVDDIGIITLLVRAKEGFLNIQIQDNGKGMTEEEIRQLLSDYENREQEHSSIGVSNVNARLILNYGKDFELEIESEKGHFARTVIRIPMLRKEKDNEEGIDCR